jgi:hypothetical protein
MHTLQHCPAWAVPRHALAVETGTDLSLPAIMIALLSGERTRSAVTSCEQVMLRKEAAERERVRSSHPERIGRRRRGGGRGRAWTRRAQAATTLNVGVT